jgi:ADP-ribose pyrophosphatase YjhB (NUDIX family)
VPDGRADDSLNPQLAQARFCPRCGAPDPAVAFPRSLSCEACGFQQYSNPKPVACVLPRAADGRIWMLRRGFDPAAGRWTIPGGFVDLGESVEQAALREVREELRAEARLEGLLGVYSRPEDRIVLVVFEGRLLGAPSTTPEATEIAAFAPAEIPWNELAFWSTERLLRDALGR